MRFAQLEVAIDDGSERGVCPRRRAVVRVYAVCPRRVVCGAARGVFMGNRVADAPGGGPNMMSGVNDRRCRQWSTECLVIVSGLTGQ